MYEIRRNNLPTHEVYGPFGCEDAARQFIKNDLDESDRHEAEAVPLHDMTVRIRD